MNKQDQNELKEKLTRLAAAEPKRQASYQDIFSLSFMQKYTNFASIDFFLKGLNLTDFTKLETVDQTKLNNFVKANSHFKTWSEMEQTAVNNYMMSLF